MSYAPCLFNKDMADSLEMSTCHTCTNVAAGQDFFAVGWQHRRTHYIKEAQKKPSNTWLLQHFLYRVKPMKLKKNAFAYRGIVNGTFEYNPTTFVDHV